MNIVFEAFGHFDGYKSNYENKYNDKNVDMYIKNSIVSLLSYKNSNSNIKLLFVTNYKLDDIYRRMFSKNGIEIVNCPYDTFLFESDLRYSLAYYKLCAFNFVVNKFPNSVYLMVDSDTFCSNSINDLFLEGQKNILIMNMDYKLSYEKSNINKTYFDLFDDEEYLPYYGSEAICCNYEFASILINECQQVYSKMIEKNVRTDVGDEFIWTAAICRNLSLRARIKDIRIYVKRIFTSFGFNNQSDSHRYDDIWHLPMEKNVGFMYIFNKFIIKNKFPTREQSSKILGITKIRKPFGLNMILHIQNKLFK